MDTAWIGLAAFAVLLAGCASGDSYAAGDAGRGASLIRVSRCADMGGCGAGPDRQQYYDERAGRYYYYDPRTRRYHWENGAPRP